MEKNIEYLKILSQCNNKMRKSIIENADKELISIICECILNCINGNVNLDTETKIKLNRHKKGGAFLPLLLSSVIGGLASLLS